MPAAENFRLSKSIAGTFTVLIGAGLIAVTTTESVAGVSITGTGMSLNS